MTSASESSVERPVTAIDVKLDFKSSASVHSASVTFNADGYVQMGSVVLLTHKPGFMKQASFYGQTARFLLLSVGTEGVYPHFSFFSLLLSI